MYNKTIDNLILKGDFLKIYLQLPANLVDSDKKMTSYSVKTFIYYQNGNAYLQYEMILGKDVAIAANRNFEKGDAIRLLNNASAYYFKEARLSTTRSSDIEHNKDIVQVSTIMRASTSKMEVYFLFSIKLMNLKLKLKIVH